ncbi:TPA: ATP-dependent Clp protease proteolytic subunit, partial [Yersinia enterocolitica]
GVLVPSYAKKTGKTPEELAVMLGEETWLTAQECVEHGFADQLLPSMQAMARINSKRIEEFDSMPASLKNMIIAPKATVTQPVAPTNPVAPAATLDDNAIRAQERESQKQRINGIKDLFSMFGGRYQELQSACVEDIDCTLEQSREKLLA